MSAEDLADQGRPPEERGLRARMNVRKTYLEALKETARCRGSGTD